jgi:hypothetical protein
MVDEVKFDRAKGAGRTSQQAVLPTAEFEDLTGSSAAVLAMGWTA